MESEYLKSLLLNSRDVDKRYIMKLRLVSGLDAFSLNVCNLDCNVDIASVLLFTHSFHSHVQMKAYIGLESYKYFEFDFVVKVRTKIENNLYSLFGQVNHSQKANAKPLDVWCITAKDESVYIAHFTFMAILFAADYANTKKTAISCTDIGAVLPMVSTTQMVPIVPVHETDCDFIITMDFLQVTAVY